MRRGIRMSKSKAMALAALLCASLMGCTVGPGYHRPSAPTPAAPNYKESPVNFQDAEGWKLASPHDDMLHGNWWEVFQQPELNELEQQLNINNETIKVYFENYLAASAVIRETRAQYYPTVSVGAGYTRSHSSGTLGSGASGTGGSSGATTTDITLPLSVSWAPDLFGRIRNAVKAARAAAQVSAADLENERLLEQATLAETFFEIRGQDELQRILDDTVKADEAVLELANARYEVGTDNQVAEEQARDAGSGSRRSGRSWDRTCPIRARNRHAPRQSCDRFFYACAAAHGRAAGDPYGHALPTLGAPP